ncbi:hypothetical protein ABT256_34420 [Amycolatopsis japonica]|uniref:hypothetical protein n=1 Tax=Amycolatopsis japonica TaxID=208439 RepID=UPI00331F67EA
MSSTTVEAKPPFRTKRSKGSVDKLPSGALRVRVYAGADKLTGKPNCLQETVPAGPDAERIADQVQRRLLTSLDEKRHPKTRATIDRILDEHFEHLDVERSTKIRLVRLAKTHIRPLIGAEQAGAMDAERWDFNDLAEAPTANLPDATLSYADGPHHGTTHVLPTAGIRIHVRHLDLNVELDRPPGQIDALAHHVNELTTRPWAQVRPRSR